VHSRYRSSSGGAVVARFNERFILSLASCSDCLILDDELNVLPISRGKDITPIDEDEIEDAEGVMVEKELRELKSNVEDKLSSSLVELAKTVDQVRNHDMVGINELILSTGKGVINLHFRSPREDTVVYCDSYCGQRSREISRARIGRVICDSPWVFQYLHHFAIS